jgi:hypothetical protein
MPLDITPIRYVLISCTCQAEEQLLIHSGPEIMYGNNNAVFRKVIFKFNVK